MEAFVKAFSTYRTIKHATVISSSLILDSLDMETSTVTVVGTGINRSDTGNWLIIDDNVYQISSIKPQSDRTLLTLVSPLDAFKRPLELDEQPEGQTVGGFVEAQLTALWVKCEDPVYAMPYLMVSHSDATPYAAPELDNGGLFQLPEYCRLMRKSHRTIVCFSDAGSSLVCTISCPPAVTRQVSFEDGRSKLQSVDYSSSGAAKLTILQDVDTGEKDENGDAITVRERSIWYLAEDGGVSQTIPARRASGEWSKITIKGKDGGVSQTIPARRASGEWSKITIKGKDDPKTKAIETFAKNKANHKLEFWSEMNLGVQDDCIFMVYGESLQSYISYKRKSSEDRRFYYKSGELAVTATEKLRGVIK